MVHVAGACVCVCVCFCVKVELCCLFSILFAAPTTPCPEWRMPVSVLSHQIFRPSSENQSRSTFYNRAPQSSRRWRRGKFVTISKKHKSPVEGSEFCRENRPGGKAWGGFRLVALNIFFLVFYYINLKWRLGNRFWWLLMISKIAF